MSVRTILAALALDEGSMLVAARARQLAAQHGARLIVIHVIEDLPPRHTILPQSTNAETILATLEAEARERLIAMSGPGADIRIEAGKPHQIITRLAEAADLIVIGPGVARNLRERVFGSTADRVVRCAGRPVLVVRSQIAGPYAHVAIGIDFSAHASAAADWAARIAPRAQRELVHAVEIPLGLEQAMHKTGTPQDEVASYRATRAANARQRIIDDYGVAGRLPPDMSLRVVQGSAAQALISASQRRRSDLVALGTQGSRAVAQHILGSVARKVLAQARCDVLVVSEPKA